MLLHAAAAAADVAAAATSVSAFATSWHGKGSHVILLLRVIARFLWKW